MVILVNDEEQAKHTVTVPMASPLFALVDVCGNTKAVSIGNNVDAFQKAQNGAAAKQKVFRGRAKSQAGKNLEPGRVGEASTSRTSVSSARAFAFDSTKHGSALKLSMNDTQAMTDCANEKAVVVTKDALPSSGSGECVSFKLEIKSIKNDAVTEGLFAVGVTT